MSNDKVVDDPRLDPRLKAILSSMPSSGVKNVANRQELLDQANTTEAKAMVANMAAFMKICDTEAIPPLERSSLPKV